MSLFVMFAKVLIDDSIQNIFGNKPFLTKLEITPKLVKLELVWYNVNWTCDSCVTKSKYIYLFLTKQSLPAVLGLFTYKKPTRNL